MMKVTQNTVASMAYILGTSIYFMSNFTDAGNSRNLTIVVFLILTAIGFTIEKYM